MIMTRTIHPIGQGAFYTECFEDGVNTYNVVYDCGSETSFSGKGKLIDCEITQTFKQGEVINALFISHFHNDHINGINKLLRYCKVKYVFLPIIDNISKLLLISSNNNKDYMDFILSPVEYINHISSSTTVISVNANNTDNEDNPQSIFDLFEGYSNGNNEEIQSGTRIVLNGYNLHWEYIPYNFKNNQLILDIENAYAKKGHRIPDANQIDQIELNFAITIFNQVLKQGQKRNAHSMIVYSGAYYPEDWDCRAAHNVLCGYNYCFRKCCCHKISTGCIYFGDFDLNIQDALDYISKKYNSVNDSISIMQVPHHGSKHNFNVDIFNAIPSVNILFISAGEKNRYRHPSCNVVKDILKSGRYLKLVTENKSSMLQFVYKKI